MKTNVALEAQQRKERSESILITQLVPINKHLPVIEIAENARFRTKEEIAYRALVLLVLAAKGEGLEQSIVEEIVKDYGLNLHFTPKEQAFLINDAPSEYDKLQFLWRYEAAWTLLWALSYVELEYPRNICDVPKAVDFMFSRNTKQFIADAKLRELSEIFDQADIIYRYHWAVVDARINGKNLPAELDSGVIIERHYALNWLIGYMEQAWDDISMDT